MLGGVGRGEGIFRPVASAGGVDAAEHASSQIRPLLPGGLLLKFIGGNTLEYTVFRNAALRGACCVERGGKIPGHKPFATHLCCHRESAIREGMCLCLCAKRKGRTILSEMSPAYLDVCSPWFRVFHSEVFYLLHCMNRCDFERTRTTRITSHNTFDNTHLKIELVKE